MYHYCRIFLVFVFKHKTAYEMRISDWSSDVCSSDLEEPPTELEQALAQHPDPATSRVGPEDLSLLEAASLIALLRACSLDHVRWTLSPLRDAGNQDRKSVVSGKSVSVSVDHGGSRIIKKKKT